MRLLLDVSFVSKERWCIIRYDPDKYLNAAPDLAVEMLSPSDTIRQTESKIADCFAHGTRLAWLVNPRRLQVRVYHCPGEHLLLEGRDTQLDGSDVLTGFKYSLGTLFTCPPSIEQGKDEGPKYSVILPCSQVALWERTGP